jgi:hypothetical protein
MSRHCESFFREIVRMEFVSQFRQFLSSGKRNSVGFCRCNALDWMFLGRGAEAMSSRARSSDSLRTPERKGLLDR